MTTRSLFQWASLSTTPTSHPPAQAAIRGSIWSWKASYIIWVEFLFTRSTWYPRGDFIVSNSDHCFIRLMYVADLKIPGYVEFEYRYTDPGVHFHFYVVDENCHEPRDASVYPSQTGHSEWKKVRVDLATGTNKLYWRTYTVTYGQNATTEASQKIKPVLLKSVYINGKSRLVRFWWGKTGTKFCFRSSLLDRVH